MKPSTAFSYVFSAIVLSQISLAQYLGQQCFTENISCADSSLCASGYCGGLNAPCTEQTVGTTCIANYRCLKGQCSDLVPVTLGSACYADQQCPGVSTCSPSELVCGGEKTTCRVTIDCASGYECISSSCTKQQPVALGGSCSIDIPCGSTATCSTTDYTCGGLDVACVATDGTNKGPSADCKPGLSCLQGTCNTLAPVALGAQCFATLQCPGSSTCSSGVCGGIGSACDQASSGSACAPNLACVANSCTISGQVAIGGACFDDPQCPTGVTCSDDGICGGKGAYCAQGFDEPGDPTLCANGASCLRGYCDPLKASVSGGACVSSSQCGTYQECSPGGICGGIGSECILEGDCHTGLECVTRYCAAKASNLGEPCTADGQCLIDPNNGNRPTCSLSADGISICGGEGAKCPRTEGFCASGYECRGGACTTMSTGICNSDADCVTGLKCSSGLCGGQGAACTAESGSSTSSDCAAGYNCLRQTCTAKAASLIGGACSTDAQCPDGTTCGSEICGGIAAECMADNGSDTGVSKQCASELGCLRGKCDARQAQPLGGQCSTDEQCTNSHCSGGICGGFQAYCDGSDNLCADEYTCNKEFKCMRRPVSQLGGTCKTYLECPDQVFCGSSVCGGIGAQCWQGSQCATGSCDGNYCVAPQPKAPGGNCLNDAGCLGGAQCTRGICGGVGSACTDASTCSAGLSCLDNKCSNLAMVGLGESCSSDLQCPQASTGPVQCRGGRCGGYGAACTTPNNMFPGSSPQCQADYTCLKGNCSPRPAVDVGEQCGLDDQCPSGTLCSANVCGGPGSTCSETAKCASTLLCVDNKCVKPKEDVPLGYFCTDRKQCGMNVDCSPDKKCGGIDAHCESSDVCYSGICDMTTMMCVAGTSAKPGAGGSRKRDFARQARIKASLCRLPKVACPVYPKGYECIDPMSNLEGCGGCVSGSFKGVDCTALPNVEDVECQAGSCVIKSCTPGYKYQRQNGTCVFEL